MWFIWAKESEPTQTQNFDLSAVSVSKINDAAIAEQLRPTWNGQ